MKRVGIAGINLESMRLLKKSALFFDSIIFDYSRFKNYVDEIHKTGDKNKISSTKQLETELFYLNKNKFAFSYNSVKILNEAMPNLLHDEGLIKDFDEVRLLTSKLSSSDPDDKKTDLFTRIDSILFSVTDNVNIYTPLLNSASPLELTNNNDIVNRENKVISLVLKEIPLPSIDEPWEKILEIRSDNELKFHLFNLKKWIVDHVYSNKNISHIEEELSYLLLLYEKQLKLHKALSTQSKIEIVLKYIVGTFEDTIKLNWSNAINRIFELRKTNIKMLQGEMKLPGREVAYINKIKEEIK